MVAVRLLLLQLLLLAAAGNVVQAGVLAHCWADCVRLLAKPAMGVAWHPDALSSMLRSPTLLVTG